MKKIYTCIIVDDEPTAREILEIHLGKIDNIEIIGICKNAIEAIAVLNDRQPDLIFLDINMPEVSGLSFAKMIPKETKVIFTTAYREYAVDGFDLQAVDYVLKPISLERLIQAVQKFVGECNYKIPSYDKAEELDRSDFIFVRSERKMVKVSFEEVLYIESLQDYLKIHTTQKTIITRETITNIEARLPQKEFLRIHRSFIVAVNKIDSFTNEHITIGKKSLSISRNYRKSIVQLLSQL